MSAQSTLLDPAIDIFKSRCIRVDCVPEEKFIETREDVLKCGYGCPNNRTDSFANYVADINRKYGKTPEFKHAEGTYPHVIYTVVTYPFKNGPYVFKFELADSVRVSYECLLYANTIAMQQLEYEETPSSHCIEELVYNGGSLIEIYADYIVCQFDCDS